MKITFYASTNEVLSELGRRIKAARIALPATQKEMAEMTNLSQKTISNLETGKDVSFSTVVEVLRALGLVIWKREKTSPFLRWSRCFARWGCCRVWS